MVRNSSSDVTPTLNDPLALQFLFQYAATGAMHDSDERFPPPLCHAGTREAVIYRVLDWYGYQKGPGKPILWVYAPAGYGKTAIAGTVVEKLEEQSEELGFNLVGATFFFWRTSAERNSPARFIITLAYQLAISIPELNPHIEDAIKRNPMILRKALEVQMKKLIVEPFKALGDTEGMPNRLIIIDGLDECINSDSESRIEKKYAEDQEIVQIRVLDLIRTLASHQLPLSFLLLSRPEAWIKQHINSKSFQGMVETLDLYQVGDHMSDVEKFVKAEFSRIGVDDEDLVKDLTGRANGHILYASIVIRHIDCPYDDPQKRLRNLLEGSARSNPDIAQSTPFSSLHELYRQILRSCPEGNRSRMVEVLEDLMSVRSTPLYSRSDIHHVLAVLDPLSGRPTGAGIKAIRGLHGVLHIPNTDNAQIGSKREQPGDTFIHSSFPSFLLSPALSLEFTVQPWKGDRRIFWGCLNALSSVALDTKVDHAHVRYALLGWVCRWVYLTRGVGADELSALLQKLLVIDLKACFVHAFTLPDMALGLYDGDIFFPFHIARRGPQNAFIVDLYSRHSRLKPLIQRAGLHAIVSLEAAFPYLLQPTHFSSCSWNGVFADALFHFLNSGARWGSWGEEEDYRSNVVVQALKMLQSDPESQDVFETLMDAVEIHREDRVVEGFEAEGYLEILDYILQGE
jgi:hypothetical protein